MSGGSNGFRAAALAYAQELPALIAVALFVAGAMAFLGGLVS